MSDDNNKTRRTSAATGAVTGNFGGLFFLVLFVLKMGAGDTAVQNWSWWWVTAPLWGTFAFVGVLLLAVAIVAGIGALLDK